jgi:K+/H+ antiporter YhaU regulatory subunit KhtT
MIPHLFFYRLAALGQRLLQHPRAVDYLELGGWHLIVAAHPPSTVGKTGGILTWQERYGATLLGLWPARHQGTPSPPAPERTIAETDVLILAGHIDWLRALRRRQ